MMTNGLPDYFEANLALLRKNHPGIWQQLTTTPPEPLGKVFPAADGKLCLDIDNGEGNVVKLHDEKHPEGEISFFLGEIPEEHTGFVALLGMGLGYTPTAILRERHHLQYLAIFELEPGIFLQALRHMDLSELLSDPRLILSVGADIDMNKTLAPASRTIQLETSQIFYHRASFNSNQTTYKKLKDQVYAHINTLNIGGTTTRALGRDFLTNRFQHITTIHHDLLLESLQNTFAGTPAILVAGGPSLDKNIHLLKSAQKKAVILAVDTVLPALLNNGIHPHFLTSIDPNNLTYEKFADVAPGATGISLICSSWVNRKTPKIFPAEHTFWVFTANPLEAWLNSLLGGTLFTTGASTVAHLNLIAAHLLGCNPIIFVGQDLAYPGKTSHAKGSVLHSNPQETGPSQTEGLTVLGIDGSMLRTDRSFLSMKHHFESIIAKTPDIRYINATEGGAHIEGTETITLQEALDRECAREENPIGKIRACTSEIPPLSPQKLHAEFRKILKETSALRKHIDKADTLSRTVLAKLTRLKKDGAPVRSFTMLPKQIQRTINEIDALHKKLDGATKIWRLLEEITMEGLKESERRRQAISLLARNPDTYSEWLQENLDRFLEINRIRIETLDLFTENLSTLLTFHEQEVACLKKIADADQAAQARLALARLYLDSGNYSLALPVVEKLCADMPDCGEAFFQLGCILSQRTEHERAAECFDRAVSLSPELASGIEAFHRRLGDEYLTFVQYFKKQAGRAPSLRYMLRKGLRYAPDHPALRQELAEALGKDLEQIRSCLAREKYEEAAPLAAEWHDYLLRNEAIAADLTPELTSELFASLGKIQAAENMLREALASFRKALEFSPDNSSLLLLCMETCFALGDFPNGIATLNRAIEIDRAAAAYWEQIGDSLQAAGQNDDAVAAYERCYLHLPEKINLLKKIGDCYMATGKLEAAKEAYLHLKNKMQTIDTTTTGVQ
ncbi:6-hydroxymethylpterin diphosphokinase MptE-like protein [Thiovibrio sp. JS02]